jgi:CRP-like cAMP-binding protein
VFEVEVDGNVVAELGPGAVIGERAVLEEGVRTATVRAKTPAEIVRVPGERVEPADLEELAAGRRREER